jgi:uncharacterized protein YacL
MVCYTTCAIASAFLFSSLIMMINIKYCSLQKDFMKTLDDNQLKIYKEIIDERFRLYITGSIIGLILGLTFLYFSENIENKYQRVCIFISLTMITQFIFYELSPKTKYMVSYLNTKEQNKKWVEMYKYMKSKYKIGFLLGIIGYIIFAYGFCKNNDL